MAHAARLLSMATATRNDALEFAARTLKNLEFIELARQQGADVHAVTHLANSLLGLVVFPLERHFVQFLLKQKLSDLSNQGWPAWTFHLGSADTLGELVYHVRNAAAHGRIYFSSDSGTASDVRLQFEDAKQKGTPVYWKASIRADDLATFCRWYIATLDDIIG